MFSVKALCDDRCPPEGHHDGEYCGANKAATRDQRNGEASPTAQAAPATQPNEASHVSQYRWATRFTEAYGNKFLHAHGIGWHEWDSTRWAFCKDGAPSRAVKALIDAAYAELPNAPDQKALWRDIQGCSNATATRGVLELAGSWEPCAVAAERMDIEANLFNTTTGTLNLTKDEVYPADPADRLTKVAGVGFNPEARSELWDTFLARVLPDAEVRGFVQRLMGYAMVGKVTEHVLPIFTGTGQNGKGTLRDVVLGAFGDYATEVDPELLMESRNPRHLTFLMELRGARLVFCSETDNGRRFAEATMKRLVGGDPIQANRMHRDPITFDPSHTLVMCTNKLPKVSGDDPAVWRRLLVVPFDVVIPPAERDSTLKERMEAPEVREAVLAWAYAGYREYRRQGLNPPAAVRARTDEYRLASDELGRFMAEETVAAKHVYVQAADLWNAWVKWCAGNGENEGNQTEFGRALTGRGFEKGRTNRGFVYRGLALRTEESMDAD